MKHSTDTLLLAIAFVVWIVAGLWAQNAAASDAAVTYRLKWLKNMSTVGDLFALRQGYFRERGLDVTIKPGGPERDAIRELELGYAQFGVASADQVIRALAKGAPVIVVAQLFQVNPLQWIYRRDRISVETLTDLKGKTLGVTFGKNDEIIMRTLLARAQISDAQVRLYSVRLDYTPFFKGVVDLWPVYINTQGVEIGGRLASSGEPVGYFNPDDHGVRFVANSVVTSQDMAVRHPDIVRNFVQALLKGWRQALRIDNGSLAVEAVRQYDRDSALHVLQEQLQATRSIVQPTPRSVIGAIDHTAWQETENIMLQHRQIAKPVTVIKYLRADMVR